MRFISSLCLVAGMLLAHSALAGFTYSSDDSTAVSGYTGLMVDGIAYDVQVRNDLCANVYGTCSAGAANAANAPSEAVFTAFYNAYYSVSGLEGEIATSTPTPDYSLAGEYIWLAMYHAGAGQLYEAAPGFADNGSGESVFSGVSVSVSNVAFIGGLIDPKSGKPVAENPRNWLTVTPAAVPLPAAAYLFLSALAGLPIVRRIKRQK